MAGNFIQPGDVIDAIAPSGGVASGKVYFVGALAMVALGIAAEGEAFRGQVCGVWSLTKKAALAITAGDPVYWDASPGEVTKTQTDGKLIGVAVADAAGDDTVVAVRLNAGTVAPQAANVAAATGVPVNQNDTTAVATAAELNALRTALINAGLMAAS